jgi:hypothetical protein
MSKAAPRPGSPTLAEQIQPVSELGGLTALGSSHDLAWSVPMQCPLAGRP